MCRSIFLGVRVVLALAVHVSATTAASTTAPGPVAAVDPVGPECTCTNGVLDKDAICTADAPEKCKSCEDKFFQKGAACEACHTSCKECSGAGAEECTLCPNGSFLPDAGVGKCEANKCECQDGDGNPNGNGTGTEGVHCPENGDVSCVSCTDSTDVLPKKYKLSFTASGYHGSCQAITCTCPPGAGGTLGATDCVTQPGEQKCKLNKEGKCPQCTGDECDDYFPDSCMPTDVLCTFKASAGCYVAVLPGNMLMKMGHKWFKEGGQTYVKNALDDGDDHTWYAEAEDVDQTSILDAWHWTFLHLLIVFVTFIVVFAVVVGGTWWLAQRSGGRDHVANMVIYGAELVTQEDLPGDEGIAA